MSIEYEVVSILILKVFNQDLYCIHEIKCCFLYRRSIHTLVSNSYNKTNEVH